MAGQIKYKNPINQNKGPRTQFENITLKFKQRFEWRAKVRVYLPIKLGNNSIQVKKWRKLAPFKLTKNKGCYTLYGGVGGSD